MKTPSGPVFTYLGLPAVSQWQWTLNLSPSYFGQGMIMGFRVSASMFLGSVLGWAILGPLAQHMKWARGPVLDNPDGGAAWLLWIALAIMFAESIGSLVVVIARWAQERWRSKGAGSNRADPLAVEMTRFDETPLPSPSHRSSSSAALSSSHRPTVIDPAPVNQRIPLLWAGIGLGASTVVALAILIPMMDMPWYEPLIAIAFSLFTSVLSVRSLGTTDMNPVSGVSKLSQLLFAAVAPGNPVSNLVAGAISEAGRMAAGDLCQDFKTGHLLRASPREQFYGQLIGTLLSTVLSVLAYCLYSSAWPIGGDVLRAPSAGIWLNMALLSTGSGVTAPHVLPFCCAFVVVIWLVLLMNFLYPQSEKYTPSIMAIGIGFYLQPRYVIPRFLGSIVQLFWKMYNPESEEKYMILTASGFVLGEGLISIIVALILTAFYHS